MTEDGASPQGMWVCTRAQHTLHCPWGGRDPLCPGSPELPCGPQAPPLFTPGAVTPQQHTQDGDGERLSHGLRPGWLTVFAPVTHLMAPSPLTGAYPCPLALYWDSSSGGPAFLILPLMRDLDSFESVASQITVWLIRYMFQIWDSVLVPKEWLCIYEFENKVNSVLDSACPGFLSHLHCLVFLLSVSRTGGEMDCPHWLMLVPFWDNIDSSNKLRPLSLLFILFFVACGLPICPLPFLDSPLWPGICGNQCDCSVRSPQREVAI